MRPVDADACRRAIALARQESPERAAQIDRKLETESFGAVGAFAAYCAQVRLLRLKPWMPPPCYGDLHKGYDPMGERGGRAAAAELLRRLLDAKLSRYEPDVITAVAAAEAARK